MNFVEDIGEIIEPSRNNTAVLNDYTTEQIVQLLQAIEQRAREVLNEKTVLLGINENEEIIARAKRAQEKYKKEEEEERKIMQDALDYVNSQQ